MSHDQRKPPPHRGRCGGVEVDQSRPEQSTKSSSKSQSHASQNGQQTDAEPLAFLQLILPDRGAYVAWIKTSDGRNITVLLRTIEDLWNIIKEADRAGHTAYHACAELQGSQTRPARHAAVTTPVRSYEAQLRGSEVALVGRRCWTR